MGESKDPYRVRSLFEPGKEMVIGCSSLKRALEAGSILIDHHAAKENRTGSLRGDGQVNLWADGEKRGYVIVESYSHGVYQKIGG